ncbi:MAG: hypothetical protein PHH60_03670, partial [Candidatus Margulisbacteria bacterium]|nr:hypothetical protein [Candidatus Margulisiibacteriota bacterium]
MRKYFLLTLALIVILSGRALAEFNEIKLAALEQKLKALAAPYGHKIGICFIDLASGKTIKVNG